MPFDGKHNFWAMGDSGPCGLCSEIHYNTGPEDDSKLIVNQEDSPVVEIWNLVFMEFYRLVTLSSIFYRMNLSFQIVSEIR